MSQERLARQVLLATHTGKRPRVRSRTRWRVYISKLTWSHFGVQPAEVAELSEIAVDREVFLVLELLDPETLHREKAGTKMNEWMLLVIDLCENLKKCCKEGI